MSEANKNLVRRHFEEIWNRRVCQYAKRSWLSTTPKTLPRAFATSIPGKVNGPAATRGTVAWLTTQYPDIHMELESMELESIVAEDDLVAVRVLSTGTNLGRIEGGPPATGKPFTARQSQWFRVADGQLCEHWATRDDLTTMLQLGVIHAPGNSPTDQ